MRSIRIIAVALAVSAASAHGQDTARTRPGPATLSGVVRDTLGVPIRDAEVLSPDARANTRTDSAGRFRLSVDTAGIYEIWFRRLSFDVAPFVWIARAGERTEIAVTMHALPLLLDTVIVRARENARIHGRTIVAGTVIDSAGAPVPEAEVQLLGSGMATVSREDGSFMFRRVGSGAYTLRARKLGYAPNVLAVDLGSEEQREITIRIRDLPATLDPVVITARSGYGRSGQPWEEFERRQLWRTTDALIVGPEDLRTFGGMPFDQAMKMKTAGLQQLAAMRASRGVRHIMTESGQVRAAPPWIEPDDCILLNGKEARYQPLRLIETRNVAMVEVYPSGTEITGTVVSHMPSSCWGDGPLNHPMYYVVWLKDAK